MIHLITYRSYGFFDIDNLYEMTCDQASFGLGNRRKSHDCVSCCLSKGCFMASFKPLKFEPIFHMNPKSANLILRACQDNFCREKTPVRFALVPNYSRWSPCLEHSPSMPRYHFVWPFCNVLFACNRKWIADSYRRYPRSDECTNFIW